MQAVRTFFRTLINSAISPAYYNDVVRAPASFSWKYFLVFNLLGALLFGLVVGVPLALLNVSGLIRQTADVYPSDLEIYGDQQGLSVNQPLPYSIELPSQWMEYVDAEMRGEVDQEIKEQNVPQNVVTFISEEQATAGARVVEDYDSFAVITPNTIYVREDEDTNEVRAYPMPEFDEPFVVDRGVVDMWVNRVADNPFFSQRLYAPVIAIFLILLSYPFILVWKIVTLAFYSLLIWIVTSLFMRDKQLRFGKIYQIGMHSMTLVTIVAIVVNILSLFTLGGVFYVVAFMIWTLYLISQLRPTSVAVASDASVTMPARTTRARRVASNSPKTKARRTRKK